MQNDRVLSTLGLAMKAGKVVSGEFGVTDAVRSGQAYLLIVAEDASDNTKKKMSNMAKWYSVPVYFYADRHRLGHSIGKEYRSAAAVLDQGFADTICKHLQQI